MKINKYAFLTDVVFTTIIIDGYINKRYGLENLMQCCILKQKIYNGTMN